MPALRNARSTLPSSRTHKANALSTCSGSETSHCTAIPPTDSATVEAASLSMSTTQRRMPSSASRCAVARPMPEAPPVTSATRPSRFIGSPLSPRVDRSPPIDRLAVQLQWPGIGRIGAVPLALDEALDGTGRHDGGVAAHHPLERASAQSDLPDAVAALQAVEVAASHERDDLAALRAHGADDVALGVGLVAVDLTGMSGDVVQVILEHVAVGVVGPLAVLRTEFDHRAVLVDTVLEIDTAHQLGVVPIVSAGLVHDAVQDGRAVFEVLHALLQLFYNGVRH